MLTIIESPYAGDIERNKKYLGRAIMDSIHRDELPFASHAIFPLALDEHKPSQREMGILLGYKYWKEARTIAFYTDYGMSPGMELALLRVKERNLLYKTEYRTIGPNP